MKITGFGDYIMHFSPLEYERLNQAECMKISFTGAEENVCAALGYWGEDVAFVTRLPKNDIAMRSVGVLKSFGIDTSDIAYGGKRMGIYFLEKGAFLRPSKVIYDRDNSSFTEANADDFDIEGIVDKTDAIYISGITPNLSENLFNCCLALCREAKKKNKKVITDVNFRPVLSTPNKAGKVLRSLAPYITTVIGNEEHFKMLLDISSSYGENEEEKRLMDITNKVKKELSVNNIAVTVRRTISASESVVFASFTDGKDFALSKKRRCGVIDRVGSGDAFSAGLLYSMIHNFPVSEAVDFASASCAIKHTVMGDINFVTVDEIKSLTESKLCDVAR